ncbi:hypothetical protein ASE31_08720 [Acidovorax sp. Root217]|nr:hypothetical protein ASE31_08720 [Acidovorax sp. Root217]
MKGNAGPLFHPKLYLFEHEDKYTAIIGSHNLTRGAFEMNIELSTLTDFAKDDPAARELLSFIEEQEKEKIIVSNAFLDRYEDLHRLAKRQKRDLDSLYQTLPDRRTEEARKKAPIHIGWDTWFEMIRKQDTHGLEPRLEVLSRIKKIFGDSSSFAAMDVSDRRRVAGLATAEMVRTDGVDWNYFGAMSNTLRFDQAFGHLALEEPQGISDALDLIPLDRPVIEEDWNAYWNALRAAVGDEGGIGRGVATRLACVKRPDVFVPLNNKNAQKLARILDKKPSHLMDAKHYWEQVVAPMRMSPWWSSNRPVDSLQAEAWEGRAALLDALVYEPTRSTAT